MNAKPVYVRLVPGEPTLVRADKVRAITPALWVRRKSDPKA